MSAGTSSTTLRGLQPDTLYTVSLVPVYAEGDGKIISQNGRTSKRWASVAIWPVAGVLHDVELDCCSVTFQGPWVA